ncbi:chaplin family protein [Streptomyces longisporoflavus]|uniref:Chaplin family protein n=1 Tax=Streptomyces longisporoflavus TaxID=28044 RepID=A0ABW7QJ50_9ACTN
MRRPTVPHTRTPGPPDPSFDATCGNSCTNVSAALAQGATTATAGTAAGNMAQLPLNLPRNQCGNSGIICCEWGDE